MKVPKAVSRQTAIALKTIIIHAYLFVKTDIAVLHMGTNCVLNAEADDNLIAESVIDIAKECVRFGLKDVFVSSVTVNTRRSSAFISAVKVARAQHCIMVVLEKFKESKKGEELGTFFTDFLKAFDCIDHNLLITKLSWYGVTPKSLKLIFPV